MRKNIKRLFAVLLALAMVIGLLPTLSFAGHSIDGKGKASDEVYVYTAEDYAAVQSDVFAKIESVKANAAQQLGGISRMTEQDYVNLVPEVINAVTSSATYVPGSLKQKGSFLVWKTTVGLPCCYSPRMEAELNNTENDPTPVEIAKAEEQAAALAEALSLRGGGPGSMDIGLIQPFWESTSNYADSSFNSYSPSYQAMWQSLADATGGSAVRYSMSNATIDNIASTMARCGLVIFDSHGDTDYASGSDYTSRANTSYLCLTATSGLTSADTADVVGPYDTYQHAMISGSHAYVDGTAIANHMPSAAPNSLLYMGICLGMATDGLHKGLRQNGVETVYGYSQSVTFVGEEIYMKDILGHVKDGDLFCDAVLQAKNEHGWWDPHPNYAGYTEAQAAANDIAFPIVVSSEDSYPGHGNVDAIQNVYSTWSLFGDAFEITAVSNNDAWGTVSVSGYTVNAAPSEGYYAESYTVLSGTATATQNGNAFSVRPDTDCTIQINFAPKTPAVVTYVSSGTTVGTVNSYVGDDVILPADATEFPDWSFVGWMTDHISMTTEKPAFMKPGDSFTVSAGNVTVFAVYKHVEGNGGLCYQLVTEAPRGVFDGRYVISSATDSSMRVMTGVAGSVNVESGSLGYTAFASTGIELEDNALRNVDEAYLFEVVERGSNAYSFQNVGAGSCLAVYESYFWVRENYESAYCNWTITPSASGAILKCTAGTSFPFLSWSGSKWMASSSSSYVQLWKEYDDGTTYYWTDPVVEEHEHEMTEYPAVAPTCGTEGHSAYYQCGICFKYFSDAAGENEITLASTVIPATGEHSFDAWSMDGKGTHTHVCAVCGAEETEPCVYDEGVVTPPTATEMGYTTYTCTVCGYSYNGDYTQALGMNYTVQFSVPAECEQPNDMISNTNTGITLPVIEGPEGYKFLGWVDDIYDNVDTKPANILSGHYVATEDITLFALFKYVDAEGGSGVSAFELVTEDPGDWTGNYVITYNNTTSLYAMKGMADGTSYETSNNGSAVAYASTGMTLEDNVLTDVGDAYIFALAQEASGNYSIHSEAFSSYVGIQNATLYALADYSASACDWNMSLNASGYTDAHLNAGGSWPYIAFSTYSYKFWCYSSNNGICFWKETEAGTPYWTTIIGEPDPGVDYTVSFSTPSGVTAPAPMVINSMTGANLPAVEAPEGYKFLGWVTDEYDNVDVKPSKIYSGKFRPQADITLYALFTYTEGGDGVRYELVTAEQADWSGNYVITCNNEPEKMILMGAVAGGSTYEAANNGGVVLFAGSGMSLENNALTEVPDNCIFSIQPLGGGYTIQNLGNETYVGRNVTTESQSARLYSYASYAANFCRWSFTWGEHGNTDSLYNVIIEHVNDAGLDGSFPYLGCGYYYFFSEAEYSENFPYFWVDGTGETYDSDVFFMYLWKENGGGTRIWTTVIGEPAEEDLVDVYFVDQDDNANAYVYAFGPGAENAIFPGEQLTPMGVDESGDNWYKITLDRNVYTNVIFSGGDNSTQTADLWVGEDDAIVYYINGHTGYVGIDLWPAPPEVIPATCTAAALENYTGLLTGEVHVHEVGLPLGHDWGEWEVTTAPGCVDGGLQTRTCARCGEIETEQIDPLGHLPGEPVQENYAEPTATEEGGYDSVIYCQRCGEELDRTHTILPPTGPAEPIEIDTIRIYPSISIGIEVLASMSVRSTDLSSYESWYIEVSKLDGEGNVIESKRFGDGQEGSVSGSFVYKADYRDITAKEMGVPFTAMVHAFDANGQEYVSHNIVSNSPVFTVRDYVIGELVNEDNADATRKLAADLLNYGAAAQDYFDFDEANLVNANLSTEAQAAMSEFATTGEAPAVLVNNANSANIFSSVSVMNRIMLTLSVRGFSDAGAVQIEIKNHDSGVVKEVIDAEKLGTIWRAKYSGFEAEDMRTAFDFTVIADGTASGTPITWSVEGYAREARLNEDATAEELALLNALLHYVDAVAAVDFGN